MSKSNKAKKQYKYLRPLNKKELKRLQKEFPNLRLASEPDKPKGRWYATESHIAMHKMCAKRDAIDHYINGQLISIAAFMVQSQSTHDGTTLPNSAQVFRAYQEALLILRNNLSNYRHNDCLHQVLDSKSYPYNVDDFVGSALNSVNASIRLLRYIAPEDEPVGDRTYRHFLSYHYNFKRLAL